MATINSMNFQPDNTGEAQINLRELTLNQWVNESLGEDPIEKYGLKDSTQVVSFLNTHKGKDLRAMIVKELIEIVKQEESLFNRIIEDKMLAEQLLAYLLFKLAYKESEQFKRLCETVQAQIDKLLNKDKNSKATEANISVELLIHLESLQSLQKEAQDITRTIEAEKHELTIVERQLEQMNTARSLFVQHHRDCEIIIDDLLAIDDHSIAFDPLSARNHLINVRNTMARVEVLPFSINQPRQDIMIAPVSVTERPRTFGSLKQEIHNTIDRLLDQGRLTNMGEENNIFGDSHHPVTIDNEGLKKLLKLSKYFLMENSKVGVNHYDSQIEIMRDSVNSRKNNIYSLESTLTNTLNKVEKKKREIDDYYNRTTRAQSNNSKLSQPPAFFASTISREVHKQYNSSYSPKGSKQ
ncbi:Uncharacterised protein [Legionella busanensis]|uniref:Uncharacterized protein n=1 Tax=Legionella busanensis TaxID=190655 RepID=A0A378KCK6_9GAMM|nr:hypothetical protein [Legionella busanensis]STX81355.1 Uncharacterised protein [Legionella busanensis]